MVAPMKKDYSQVTPSVVEAYKTIRNVTKVARLFNMSPATARRILDEAKVQVGRSGVQNSQRRKRGAYDKASCFYCHKYSRTTPITGWCLKHRRSVAARNIESCFD